MDHPRQPAARRWTTDELITRCLANEDSAWQEFLYRYARLMYATIIRTGLSRGDQPDAFQASMIAIYRGLPKLRDRSRLTPWIISISSRQAISSIRRFLRESQRYVPTEDVPKYPSKTPLPSDERVRLERAQQAQEALEMLPERCQRLLTYLFREDPTPSYEEIARREGIPVGSLGPNRARCLERMRRYFEERGWST